MDNVIVVTKKAIRSGAKTGKTTEDFCNKYQLQEEDFREVVFKIFDDPSIAKDLLDQIHKNGTHTKRANKKKGPGKKKATAQATTIATEAESPTEQTENTVLDLDSLSVEELSAEEKKVSTKLMEVEKEIESLRSKRYLATCKMSKIEEWLIDIQFQVVKKEGEFKDAKKERDDIDEQTETKKAEKAKLETTIKNIRNTIVEKSKVTFFVYENGEITCDEVGFQADYLGCESKFDSLIKGGEYDNLRVTELRTLAQVLTIAKNSDRKLEFIFDSEELEQAYKKAVHK